MVTSKQTGSSVALETLHTAQLERRIVIGQAVSGLWTLASRNMTRESGWNNYGR